ncbi:DUF3530 family protein [Marinomonas transparens]|uniref:Alpha/beta hydrolase family protein n=1 Tax=Marinomonas transparens TaxID=2795388 RepID=A0A934JNV9_9GAMM|nr:DUF3530 family protein [Marinomonas transparens]MBJ7537003.1 alpha/beta hydrolase family protein [Marinomonas transparens]
MKKNYALFISLLTTLAVNTSSVLAADEPQNTTTPTTDKNDTPRVAPTPQATRIKALEADLTKKNLQHQILTLEADGTPFLALYEPSLTSSTQGCVILIHADNEHPNWPSAISPLRNALPSYSWCTLSIEVPDIIKRAIPVKVTPISTEDDDNKEKISLPNQQIVFARIQAAIAQAKSDEVESFVFLGYKTGASYALNFLVENKSSGEALVLIDMETPEATPNHDIAQLIRQIPQPILDYYTNNNASKQQFALWRQQAANQRKNTIGDFIQLDAQPDRAHGNDSKPLLIQRVRGFLKQNTSQVDQQKPFPEYKKGLFYKSP